MSILEKIDDLIKQATEERSHYYVGSVLKEAKERIQDLECEVLSLKGPNT